MTLRFYLVPFKASLGSKRSLNFPRNASLVTYLFKAQKEIIGVET